MNYFFSFIKVILNTIRIIENIICGIGLWLVNILIFFAVLNRYFLHLPILWLNDLALYTFVFFSFTSIALTTREEEHISVSIFRQSVFKGKPKADNKYSIFLNIFAIASILLFIPAVYRSMLRAMKYPEYATLMRWFNTSWLATVMFITILLILIHLIASLVKDISKLKELHSENGGKK